MVTEAGHAQAHLSSKRYRWLRSRASLALALTLLLLGITGVAVLASSRTASTHNLAIADQMLAPAQSAQQMAQATAASAGSSFTEPITSTAFLPIIVRGYPPPYEWTGEIVATYPNCTLTRLFGFVLNQYSEPVGDVWVHYWADNYDGDWDKSSWEATGDHNWDGTLDNRPREVVWYACVVPEKKSWDCLSNTVEAPTSANCEKGIQVYQIDFRQN